MGLFIGVERILNDPLPPIFAASKLLTSLPVPSSTISIIRDLFAGVQENRLDDCKGRISDAAPTLFASLDATSAAVLDTANSNAQPQNVNRTSCARPLRSYFANRYLPFCEVRTG